MEQTTKCKLLARVIATLILSSHIVLEVKICMSEGPLLACTEHMNGVAAIRMLQSQASRESPVNECTSSDAKDNDDV
jgi:hypothetical protein